MGCRSRMALEHANACAPRAIVDALEHYDYTNQSRQDVSQNILKHGSIFNLT